MEITSVRSFLEYYERVRARTNSLIQTVPPDQLEWTYMPGKFSIGDQIRHIATIERYMFAETVAGRVSRYHGCGVGLAGGFDEVVRFFDELHRQSLEIFNGLADEDLGRLCSTPGNTEIPVWKWLRAMVEHEIHHRGELYIYLNLLGVKTPPIFGLTAEEVEKRSLRP